MRRIKFVDVECPECEMKYKMRSNEYNLMVKKDKGWLILKCPRTDQHYKIKLRKLVEAVPKETKQKILDLLHKGLTVGEVRKKVNLDLMVVSTILCDNIHAVHFLNKEAK